MAVARLEATGGMEETNTRRPGCTEKRHGTLQIIWMREKVQTVGIKKPCVVWMVEESAKPELMEKLPCRMADWEGDKNTRS